MFLLSAQEKHDDEIVLVCSADANPASVSFSWRHGNQTILHHATILNQHQSSVRLENIGVNMAMRDRILQV